MTSLLLSHYQIRRNPPKALNYNKECEQIYIKWHTTTKVITKLNEHKIKISYN